MTLLITAAHTVLHKSSRSSLSRNVNGVCAVYGLKVTVRALQMNIP